jgi:hypothetical protein
MKILLLLLFVLFVHSIDIKFIPAEQLNTCYGTPSCACILKCVSYRKTTFFAQSLLQYCKNKVKCYIKMLKNVESGKCCQKCSLIPNKK